MTDALRHVCTHVARLVVSEFTAERLPGTITVNPHDRDALADAIGDQATGSSDRARAVAAGAEVDHSAEVQGGHAGA